MVLPPWVCLLVMVVVVPLRTSTSVVRDLSDVEDNFLRSPASLRHRFRSVPRKQVDFKIKEVRRDKCYACSRHDPGCAASPYGGNTLNMENCCFVIIHGDGEVDRGTFSGQQCNGFGDDGCEVEEYQTTCICTTDRCNTNLCEQCIVPTTDPATTDYPDPVTTDYPDPVTTDYPDPATTDYPDPATTDYPDPATTDYPDPATTDYPDPVTTDYPDPVTTDYPDPATTDYPDPVTTDYPDPVTTDYPITDPGTTENPSTGSASYCYYCDNYPGTSNFDPACGEDNYNGHWEQTSSGHYCFTSIHYDGSHRVERGWTQNYEEDESCYDSGFSLTCYCTRYDNCNTDLCQHCYHPTEPPTEPWTEYPTDPWTEPPTESPTTDSPTTDRPPTELPTEPSTEAPTTEAPTPPGVLQCYSCIGCNSVDDETDVEGSEEFLSCFTAIELGTSHLVIRGGSPDYFENGYCRHEMDGVFVCYCTSNQCNNDAALKLIENSLLNS